MKTSQPLSNNRQPAALIARGWQALRASWFWEVVLLPFLVTRAAWVLAAAFARGTLQPNPTYARYFEQGGMLTRVFLLDIFAHWDAKHYLGIIENGYMAGSDFTGSYSNSAFFPLYPYLVKGIGWLGIHLLTGLYLLGGILLSNLCFLAAMALLRRLALGSFGLSEAAVRRAVLLIMVFPTSFIFSSFYPESLFLMLALLGFTAAFERRWWLAGLAAGLASVTRVQGLLVVFALLLIYLQQRGWDPRKIRADVLWFLSVPALLGAHLAHLARLTGTPLAPLLAQQAWKRNTYGLLEGLRLQLEAPALDVFKIDGLMVLLFFTLGVILLLPRRSRIPWTAGVFAILMCVVPVATGMLISATRFMAAVFPGFLLLGEQEPPRWWYRPLLALWFTLQILYFAAWANFYWVA